MTWYLHLENWGLGGGEWQGKRQSGIRGNSKWDQERCWVGCGHHTEVRWENKWKGTLNRRVNREWSERFTWTGSDRLVPRVTLQALVRLLSFFQQPPGSLEAVPCWKGQASSCLHATVIKQCWRWTDTWIYGCLWSDFTSSLSINLLAEGLNTVHLFLSYIMSAYFKHVGGGVFFLVFF